MVFRVIELVWRDYPFFRMANVHVELGPVGSPKLEVMIADVKDGVMIDRLGSYCIDRQGDASART